LGGAVVKIRLITREGTIDAKLPHEGAKFVEVAYPCSECGSFQVAGVQSTIVRGHDTYRSKAVCVGCGHACGELEAKVETIFGLAEDELVMQRPRVY
jgi:hypothetical protein